jgi:hypothetical protein
VLSVLSVVVGMQRCDCNQVALTSCRSKRKLFKI